MNPIHIGRNSGAYAGASAGATRASVAIGFGSPSGDTGVTRLDLNDILVRHPQATFLMRIAGHAMREAGIDSGDLVLIDRAIPPAHGHLVMEAVDTLNRRFGKGAVAVASAQHQRRHDQHAGRQLRRSPRSTTRLGEIATARA